MEHRDQTPLALFDASKSELRGTNDKTKLVKLFKNIYAR